MWVQTLRWYSDHLVDSKEHSQWSSTGLTHQSLFTGLGEYCYICGKKSCIKVFSGPRRSCVKSRKLFQVMSLESVGVEVFMFENEEIWRGQVRNIGDLTRPLQVQQI